MGQKIIIISVIVLTIVMIGVVNAVSNQTNYAVLVSGLSDDETGAIYSALQGMGIEVESAPGNTILVPDDEVDDIRMQLNAAGITYTPNLEVNNQLYLDNAMTFGATDADKERIYQFQLEQKLTQTINQTAKVENSVVLLSPAEDSDYVITTDGIRMASATVTINPKPGQTWTEADSQTIQSIVAGAVPEMTADQVTVVNQATMDTYSGSGGGGTGGAGTVANQIELEAKVSRTLTNQILNLFSPVFGPEKLTANVNAVLDFDKKTTESVTLAPVTDMGEDENMGIIVSRKRMQERVQNTAAAEGEPGMDPNGGAPVYQTIGEVPEGSVYYQITEEINAEVNEVKEQIEAAQGQIKSISATLIIDGGEELADILPEVRNQISTAVGIPVESITVSSMPFEQNTLMQQAMEEQAAALQKQQQSDLIQRIITVGAILGGIIIVVALILSAIKKKREQDIEAERLRWMQEQEQREAGGINLVADEPISIEDILAQEEGGTLGQLQALVKKNPDGIAQVLRNWLVDDFRR